MRDFWDAFWGLMGRWVVEGIPPTRHAPDWEFRLQVLRHLPRRIYHAEIGGQHLYRDEHGNNVARWVEVPGQDQNLSRNQVRSQSQCFYLNGANYFAAADEPLAQAALQALRGLVWLPTKTEFVPASVRKVTMPWVLQNFRVTPDKVKWEVCFR